MRTGGWRAELALATAILAAASGLAVGVVGSHATTGQVRALRGELRTERAATAAVQGRLASLEASRAPDQVSVTKKVSASVVTVETSVGLGAGFVLKAQGGTVSIVTNYHVVADDVEKGVRDVLIRSARGDAHGHVDATNKTDDVALVRVSLDLQPLARVSTTPDPGTPVLVVGSPMGLENSVSSGVVSALRDGMVQFSAPISPGNSGGPVVDLSGRVIGIARSKLVGNGAEGLSFAVPISVVCGVLGTC